MPRAPFMAERRGPPADSSGPSSGNPATSGNGLLTSGLPPPSLLRLCLHLRPAVIDFCPGPAMPCSAAGLPAAPPECPAGPRLPVPSLKLRVGFIADWPGKEDGRSDADGAAAGSAPGLLAASGPHPGSLKLRVCLLAGCQGPRADAWSPNWGAWSSGSRLPASGLPSAALKLRPCCLRTACGAPAFRAAVPSLLPGACRAAPWKGLGPRCVLVAAADRKGLDPMVISTSSASTSEGLCELRAMLGRGCGGVSTAPRLQKHGR